MVQTSSSSTNTMNALDSIRVHLLGRIERCNGRNLLLIVVCVGRAKSSKSIDDSIVSVEVGWRRAGHLSLVQLTDLIASTVVYESKWIIMGWMASKIVPAEL